ncbi:DHHA1 domain protein [Candidatus Bilamarchaeum dharawalense]|uniref:DHHA1 domain protein n=1 Tax=Candidatus Bilamarchaeum dharawalense TaxID=2885759 RepID=A0A5E4LSD4_9ARCH|nr:DHHA1 domain protein [Candidatus Bilamarchaeum dharawalense]
MERAVAEKEIRSLAKYKKIAIATHSRADVDGLSAAYALTKVYPNSVICSSEEPGEGAKMLAARLGIKVEDISNLKKSDFDGLVVVDTSAYTLLPEAKGWKILMIIDHHRAEGRDMQSDIQIVDVESPSTAEIIANILPEMDRETAFALSVGIIADGARFKSARTQTFETLAKLMTIANANYSELLAIAEPDPKDEAKIAILTAMKRLNFIYIGGYVVATTEVGSNESDAASLIAEAADVVFVAKWKDREKETRISARARASVKIPLNEVMDEVAKELGGAGGGHKKAAGAALKCHTDEALKTCIDIFSKKV